MSLHLEVRAYKKSTSHPDEIIFDEAGDLDVYNSRAAWDLIPAHFFRPTVGKGGGGRVRLEFKSSADADKGLTILKDLKTPKES